MNLDRLLAQIEIQLESKELALLGLTQEEIDGYFEFYIDNYPEFKLELEVIDKQ